MKLFVALLLTIISGLAAVPLDSTRSIDLRGKVGAKDFWSGRTTVWTNYQAGVSTSADIAFDLNHSVPTNVIVGFPDTNAVYTVGSIDLGGISAAHGSYITLRGSGPGRTTIQPPSIGGFVSGGFINARPGTRADSVVLDTGKIRDWTSGYSQGTSNITINADGTSGGGTSYDLKVGTVICLDQRDDPNLALNDMGFDGSAVPNNFQMLRQDTTNGISCTASSSTDPLPRSTFTATGHAFNNGDRVLIDGSVMPSPLSWRLAYWVVNKTANTFQLALTSGGAAIDLGSNGSGLTAYKRVAGRIQTQYTEVQSISNGTNLVIWPPVALTNIQSSLVPQIWWSGDYLEGISIEDMTIDLTHCTNGSGSAHEWACWFQSAKNCRMKNVEIIGSRKGLFGTWCVLNIESEHCYTHQPMFSGTVNGASQYGCNPQFGSGFLIHNCAWKDIATPINIDWGASLGAIAYCYMTNDVYLSGFFMGAGIQSHGLGANGWTIEGCTTPGINFDFIHGTSMFDGTIYRNRNIGFDLASAGPDNANTFAVFIMAWNRYNNVVGNIDGYSGYHLNEKWYVNAADPSNTPNTELRVGHTGNNSTTGDGDASTVTTLWLDGNFTTVGNTTRWDASDSSHTLPDNSRVYYAKPTWWTNYIAGVYPEPRWPLKGPDLSPMDAASPIQREIDGGTFGTGGGGGGGTSGGGTSGGGTSTNGAAKSHGRVQVRGRNVWK